MTLKWIGAFFIFTGCGTFGFTMAGACRREEDALVQLHRALEFMSCELTYRMPPLPQLCRSVSNCVTGPVSRVFLNLAQELERQTAPDVRCCMHTALEREPRLSVSLQRLFRELGTCLGRFDLPGQLRGLEGAIRSVEQALRLHRENHTSRLRSYQTLGLCAGAALAILFL